VTGATGETGLGRLRVRPGGAYCIRGHFVDTVTTFDRFSTLESGRHVYKVYGSG